MAENQTAWKVDPLDCSFGALVDGLSLADLSDAQFASLYALWLEYGLLIFPKQHLDREQQDAFAARFGELEFSSAPISNVKSDGTVRDDDGTDDVVQVLRGNMGWHCDSTYMPVQAKGAVFTAHVVPDEGGTTQWADMCAAYDAMPEAAREDLATLSAYHSLHYSQARMGHKPDTEGDYSGYGFHDEAPPLRPLIKIHPETGRAALAIGRHAYGIPGMEADASEQLLDQLVEFACQPPRVYEHRWTPGDAVVWDNRWLMHRAMPWDMRAPRVMYHTRIAGDPISEGVA